SVYARIGRFGPLAQIGESDDPDKKFMSLAKGQLIETITLEEALNLFRLPRLVGTYKGEEILSASGRFGPYIKYKGSFISIGKNGDPYTIDLESSINIIEENAKKEAQKNIKSFPEDGIELLNGRYGPYIKKGKENFKIPKGTDPASMTIEEIKEIIEKTQSSGKPKRSAPKK
ncbi:MAG: topoisomerase C-terminal repeat-containing protein, partial [Bacteroidales bacterium]|nr:topoisomerase C-terminal repeat-containing protein [Bacteroidales bacterium]